MLLRIRFVCLVILTAFLGAVCGGAQSDVCINEIMAANDLAVRDPQGGYDDWIELFNPADVPAGIGGLYLTDDLDDPTKWRLPAGTVIPAKGYLVVWADGDVGDAGLHADLALNASGDRIALFDRDGGTLIDSVRFGRQRADVSFGRDPDGSNDWVTLTPTPGASNDGKGLPVVEDLVFNHDRGFYDHPIEVVITTATPQATIRFTLDGSTPTPTYGSVYNGPILIQSTTCLRAMAFRPGWKATDVETHTYVFLESVIGQATHPSTGAQVTPEGYPTSWGSVTGDYQMDPDVVGQGGKDIFGGLYADSIRDDLKAVPTISLVMNKDDWFGNKGIYINQSQDGTERVASMEFIDPNGAQGFQINCAIAMQGGVSGGGTSLSRWKTFKLSMRPRFKARTDDGIPTGGPGKLDFRLFPDSPLECYNTVVLDSVLNHSWLHPDSGQRDTAIYIQDQYIADLHNAMGGHSPHGAYAHLYINGLYWGLYYIHERPDHAWAAQVFGGDEDEYDAIKHSGSSVINSGADGSASANYNAMLAAANALAADPDNLGAYDALCGQLDIDDFITYLLANWYTGNHDWPHKNWYATHRNAPGGKWRFHSWDAEHVLEGGNDVGESPSDIHRKLAQNAEYRLRFADQIYRHFFHDGPLSYPASADRFLARMKQVERAIVGESARWGDNRQSRPYTQQDWLKTQESKLSGYFPNRANQVLSWLRSAGLYPNIEPPEFHVGGVPQHGGPVASGQSVSLVGDFGTIWYTMDGTDPRTPGSGGQTGDEFAFVTEDAPKAVLVPVASTGDAWRSVDFDDSTWTHGTGGVGYERSSGYEQLFDIDVQEAMYGHNASCYIRIPFEVTPEVLIEAHGLRLRVRYDDGFVAYLNGVEVQRAMFDGTPSWNSGAAGSHSDLDAIEFETFDISSAIAELRLGRNVLAIHGLNQGITSSDFLISVELTSTIGGGGAVPSGISPAAVRYTEPLTPSRSVHVMARSLQGGVWSALNEATFSVGLVAESLRISEVMYHPLDPNAEYIELVNVGREAINLNLVAFTDGVDFTFPDIELAPGAYSLVVRDRSAFEAAYGDGGSIAGQYAGSLDNAGERIELRDAAGQVIQHFRYQDDWYDLTDGAGFSLTVRDPRTAGRETLDEKSFWRPSAEAGGSPGYDDAGLVPELGAVVINEILANPAGGACDWIELHNTTSEAIDVGGWFLSDDADDRRRYEIASGTVLGAGGYLVFEADATFDNGEDPGCRVPFGLSRNGETLYLHSGVDGVLTGYSVQEQFDASERGVPLGRHRQSTGGYHFVSLSVPTPGAANAEPRVGPVVISEIMYHPAETPVAEYVELLNISEGPVTLYDAALGIPWRFTDDPDDPRIDLRFPSDPPITLASGGHLLLVKDRLNFAIAYGEVSGVPLLPWGPGRLPDDGGRMELSKPGAVADDGTVIWIRVDRVVYGDGSHPGALGEGVDSWPAEADGRGLSLHRTPVASYGNDPAHWQAATPSPGALN
ncbi:MAG TPA: lamin tail domain-containing protein [Sedimentisphaerales bacterium]|nr:lamin tail domain-containing protein [Sedimentisphaerales bacterium]